MLHLAHPEKPRTASLPPSVTTLSVSWLNGQFKAIAVQRGVIEGAWEHPGETDGTQHFEQLLREATQQTGYRGTTVSLLLRHQRLTQQLVETPLLRGQALQKLLRRQAEQQKPFEGDPAWTHQPAFSPGDSQRLVLHLFPKVLLDQLIQGAQRNDLFLTSVLPSTAVLQGQLERLPLQKNDIALLAADTGGSTTVIIGRSDGQVLLARTLGSGWNTEAARLAVDLSRTILFVNQQYGTAVDKGVWLFGPNAKDHLLELQRQIQVPVKVSPVEQAPFYWATEALRVPPGQTPNFISLELRKAPQRKVFLKVTTTVTIVTTGACLAASLWCEVQHHALQAARVALQAQQRKLQARHLELQQLQEELRRKQGAVKRLAETRVAPAPAWLLAALSEVTPPGVVVTNFQVRRQTDVWQVEVGGAVESSAPAGGGGPPPSAAAALKARLSGAPFHLRFAESDVSTNAAPAKRPVFSGWAVRGPKLPAAKTEPTSNFALEGVMR